MHTVLYHDHASDEKTTRCVNQNLFLKKSNEYPINSPICRKKVPQAVNILFVQELAGFQKLMAVGRRLESSCRRNLLNTMFQKFKRNTRRKECKNRFRIGTYQRQGNGIFPITSDEAAHHITNHLIDIISSNSVLTANPFYFGQTTGTRHVVKP